MALNLEPAASKQAERSNNSSSTPIQQLILAHLEQRLLGASDGCCRLQALASAKSLIFNNPDTSRRIIETLARCLDHERHTSLLRHVLNLLRDIAVAHRSLSPLVVDTVRSRVLLPLLRSEAKRGGSRDRLLAASLAVFVEIGSHNGGFFSDVFVFEEDLLLSLLFSPVVSVRSRILDLLISNWNSKVVRGRKQAESCSFFLLRPSLMFGALLGLTEDSLPLLRKAALDGLVVLSKTAGNCRCGLTESCYDRAIALLLDTDAVVRSAAIRLICEWGQMLEAKNSDVDNREQIDVVFIQICSMARDMSPEVRIEAFIALGKISLVSESLLLQTLSKRILQIKNEKKNVDQCSRKELLLVVSSAAGAFVHGIEDEFYEVRRAACDSLGMLTIFSIKFADDALNLLTDILNDDTIVVRLQTLHTMFHMAANDRLKVQEKHMHMYLSVLVDVSALIRCAARKLLRVMKLPNLEIFKSSIDGLLTNLEAYPEDEQDIFSVLFDIGRSHGNFVASLAKEFSQEVVGPSCDGELGFDRPRIAALLVLAIASPLSYQQLTCDIPKRIFSYAVPLLGRISCSLGDVMSRDSLLTYLCHFKTPSSFSATTSTFKEGSSLQQINDETSNIQVQNNLLNMGQVSTPVDYQHKVAFLHEDVTHAIMFILRTVAATWPLIRSSSTDEVLRTLRLCKQELEMLTWHSHDGSVNELAFAFQYVHIFRLIAKIWDHLKSRKFRTIGIGVLDILLEKLDISLRRMRCAFPGLSKEEEYHILELILLSCVLRLSKIGVYCYTTLKRLCATVSRIDFLCEEGFPELSNFAREIRKHCFQGRSDEVSNLFPADKLLEIFSLEQIVFSGQFKHIKAEMHVPDNDSENPIPFISGLPVGIKFQITLYNISSQHKLWLQKTVGESIQYSFLDLNQFQDSGEERKCSFTVPFYRTPNAASFTLTARIGMECPFEDVIHLTKGGRGGPKCELTFLCKEKDVYLAIAENK